MHKIMITSIAVAMLCLGIAVPSASAAERGFVEPFDTVEATYTWNEWSDEYFYFPWWEQEDEGLSIYSTFKWATFLWASDESSEGKLSGDFLAAKIAGLEADVYADWPSEVDNVYLYLYSGTESNLYSYGPYVVGTNWVHVSASLDATDWDIDNGIDPLTTGPIPDSALTNVTEVGIYAEAVEDLVWPTIVNLDNFGLIAEKLPPELDIRLLGDPDTTEVSWLGRPGQSYTLQYRGELPSTNLWTNVVGAVDLVGMGLDLAVTNVESAVKEFYRATTDTNSYTHLTPVGMQLVPFGTSYWMGDNTGEGAADESPNHLVGLSAYRVDRHEVTNMKMADVLTWALASGRVNATTDSVWNVEGTSYELVDLNHPDCRITYLPDEALFEVDTDKELHPCTAVTWYGAQAFANYLSDIEGFDRCINFFDWSCDFSKDGYRLPTEAQWEIAARGGLVYHHYPWPSSGSGFTSFIDGSDANYDGSGDPFEGTAPETTPIEYYDGAQVPAGSDMANAYGLYDMAGNVREWVWDYYQSDAYSQIWVYGPDPTGPITGTTRVMRGGAWSDDEDPLRCSSREDAVPTTADGNTGFRCVRRTQ